MRGASTILGVLLMLLFLISFTVTLTRSLQSSLDKAALELRDALDKARMVASPVKARISGNYVEVLSEGPVTRVVAIVERLSNGSVRVTPSGVSVGSKWERVSSLTPGYSDVWVVLEGGRVIKPLPLDTDKAIGIGDIGGWYAMLVKVEKYAAFHEQGPVTLYTYTPEPKGTTYIWPGESAELVPSSPLLMTNVTIINSTTSVIRFSACNTVRYYQVGIIASKVFRYFSQGSSSVRLTVNAILVRDTAPTYERDFMNISLVAYVIPGSRLPYHFVTMPTYLLYLSNIDYANFDTYPRIVERDVLWKGNFLRGNGVYTVSNSTSLTLLPGEGYIFVGIEISGCPGTIEISIDTIFSG